MYSDPEKRKEYGRKHYRENKAWYRDRNRRRREEIRAYVENAKRKPCMDCNAEYPPYVMDFDHRGDKKFNVAMMCTRSCALDRVKEEIAKCDLVCSNCHRIRTHKRT